jgi:hypothetical protein
MALKLIDEVLQTIGSAGVTLKDYAFTAFKIFENSCWCLRREQFEVLPSQRDSHRQ